MIQISHHGHVRTLTLNRPEALNAFSEEMYEAVRAELNAARADDEVSVCVLTGAGKVFSTGRDLLEAAQSHPAEQAGRGLAPFLDALTGFDKPLLAAVNGPAVGLGAALLLHCDLVYLADAARVRFPLADLAMVPEAGSSFLLPWRVGEQAAAHLFFTGAWLNAAEAVACGFAQAVYPADELLDRVIAIAQDIATTPMSALFAAKRLLASRTTEAVAAARGREDAANARLASHPARAAALAAFLESVTADSKSQRKHL